MQENQEEIAREVMRKLTNRGAIHRKFQDILGHDIASMGPDGIQMAGIAAILSLISRDYATVDPFGDVTDFHRKYGINYDGPVRYLDKHLARFRECRQREEHKEYIKAVRSFDKAGEFDALIDSIYIALGTIHLHGWNFYEGWRRVHAKNMEKRLAGPGEGKYNGAGIDIVKPEGWTAPDLSDLVKVK